MSKNEWKSKQKKLGKSLKVFPSKFYIVEEIRKTLKTIPTKSGPDWHWDHLERDGQFTLSPIPSINPSLFIETIF